MASLDRKHSSHWHACFRDATGKQRRKSTYIEALDVNRAAAQAVADEMETSAKQKREFLAPNLREQIKALKQQIEQLQDELGATLLLKKTRIKSLGDKEHPVLGIVGKLIGTPDYRYMRRRGMRPIIAVWEISPLPKCHYVYFLLYKGDIQYVGKGSNAARMQVPRHFPVDKICFIETDEQNCSTLETWFIQKLQPLFNTVGTDKAVRESTRRDRNRTRLIDSAFGWPV